MEGLPDVGLGHAVQGIAGLFVQDEVAMDERLQGTTEAAFHPPRPPSNPADFAVLQREEGDDPVGVAPLAALQYDGRGLEQGHGSRLPTSSATGGPWPDCGRSRSP